MSGNENSINNIGILPVLREFANEFQMHNGPYTGGSEVEPNPYRESQTAYGSSLDLDHILHPRPSAQALVSSTVPSKIHLDGARKRSLEAGDRLASLDHPFRERPPEFPQQGRLAGAPSEGELDMAFTVEELYGDDSATEVAEGPQPGLSLVGRMGPDGDGDPMRGEGYGLRFGVESNGQDPLEKFRLSTGRGNRAERDPLADLDQGLFEALGI